MRRITRHLRCQDMPTSSRQQRELALPLVQLHAIAAEATTERAALAFIAS